jgi:hypothetical protein
MDFTHDCRKTHCDKTHGNKTHGKMYPSKMCASLPPDAWDHRAPLNVVAVPQPCFGHIEGLGLSAIV